jgi:hypothetical protein
LVWPASRPAGQVRGGGEAPGAVDNDADRDAQLIAVLQRLEAAVGQAELLARDPLGAEISMLGAEIAGALQGGIRHGPQRVGSELRVDVRHDLPTYTGPRAAAGGARRPSLAGLPPVERYRLS